MSEKAAAAPVGAAFSLVACALVACALVALTLWLARREGIRG